MNNVLLDSNILIEAINDKKSNSAQKIRELMKNDDIKIFITPLIIYEILRGIELNDDKLYQKFKDLIESFSSLNIDNEIGQLASHLFRLERHNKKIEHQESKKIDKHNFDLVHFSTAKIYDLKLISNDKDMENWENLYKSL